MNKTNVLEEIISLGIDAYIDRANSFAGRRILEGKTTSSDTIERLKHVCNELIDIRFQDNGRREFDGETLQDYIRRIEAIG
jgi:hypothetical protein